MIITVNGKEVELTEGATLLDGAQKAGYTIPTMCFANDAKHKSSCMVCAVMNCANGQILPSCSTLATNGISIDTESTEVKLVRRLSLELLLSDHRADCEAPCSIVCPQGLDVEKLIRYYDADKYAEAYALLSLTFALPDIGCDNCKAPCEKACRRGTIDNAVEIRKIIKEIAAMHLQKATTDSEAGKIDKNAFTSRLGRFTDKEKVRVKKATNTKSRCLHCACDGKNDCKLRQHANSEGIKRPRYDLSSALPIKEKQLIVGNMWFEPAKCIRCGLCVYNSTNGFTFQHRGFEMQVIIPEENKKNVSENLAKLCPTGALYIASQ